MDRDTLIAVDGMLDTFWRQLSLVASRATIDSCKDDKGIQGIKAALLADEVTPPNTEHMQQGGISHVPLPGSEGVFLSIGGVRDDGVIFSVTHRKHRPKGGKPGETTVYNAGDKQSTIKLLEDGSVVITSGGSKKSTITLTADGDLNIVPGGKYNFGENPTSPLSLTEKVDARFDALEQWAITHINGWALTHTHAHPMGPTGPALPAAQAPQPGQPTGSEIGFSK